MPPGFEPNCGSVRPKHPIAFPLCSLGSHLCFCAGDPYAWIGYITRALWTETKLRNPESPRSSSCITRPYATFDIPAQPYPSRFAPKKPSSASFGTSSVGKVAARLCFSMIGITCSSTNSRAVFRASNSSSWSKESKSRKSTPGNAGIKHSSCGYARQIWSGGGPISQQNETGVPFARRILARRFGAYKGMVTFLYNLYRGFPSARISSLMGAVLRSCRGEIIRSNHKWNHRDPGTEVSGIEALKFRIAPVELSVEVVAPTRLVQPNTVSGL